MLSDEPAAAYMTKTTQARILTAMLIAAIAGFFAYRQRKPAPASDNTPESAVWRMLDAARAADPEQYLACYTGEMERLLRRNYQEMGAAGFREYLARTHSPVKGVAVSPPQMTSSTEGRIAVEYVYQDRNEVQQVHVRRVGIQWKIAQVETVERMKTVVPYGTPVNE